MAFKTQEQIEAEIGPRLSSQVEAARADHAKRLQFSPKRVVITLAASPEERSVGEQRVVAFTGSESGRSPLSAVYFLADHQRFDAFGRDDHDQRVASLRAGDKLTLAGQWSKRKWKGRDGADMEAWEFKAQQFERGDVPLAEMGTAALARIEAFAPAAGAAAPASQRDAPVSARPAASPRLTYASGNIVDDRAQVLVNTVNSQLSDFGNPVMGAGVALAFKERFPSIMRPYGDAIKSGELTPGRALLFDLPDGRQWAALATKDHYKDSSKEAWVEAGLKELGEKMRAAGLTSVALPPPGCGNGGLDWKKIEPLVHRHLAGLDVSLYAKPSGAMEPAKQIAARQAGAEQGAARARTLAAFGVEQGQGGVAQTGSTGWSEDDLIALIPTLLNGRSGYNPYAGIGSRETTQDVCDDMTASARVLEARGFTLRSGFAGGADTAFELGTTKDSLREIFAPWKGFGSNPNSPHEKKRWDQIARHEQITGQKFTPAKATLLEGAMFNKAEDLAKPHHPKWDALGDGPRKMHTRNMGQVFGPKLDVPARFEMAYTVDGKATGGTGQAIRVAEASGIPVLNMHNPRIRAAVLAELGLGPVRDLARDMAVVAAARARTENRDRYEGASMSAPMRDSMREQVRQFKQGETLATPAPSKTAGDRGAGEFDLGTPPVRSRNKDDVASFCKVADPLGSLSNMYNKSPIVLDGVTWKSSEALYQAMRFPDHPDLQERIRTESNAFTAKVLAHEFKHLSRPDWNDVNHHAMAFVTSLKYDQSEVFRRDLESTAGRDVVELSVKDDHWGAKPRGDQLVGHDVLGHILTQLRDGARMDEPPEGSMLLGRPIGRSAETVVSEELPAPAITASMYFKYGSDRREGFKSESTFEAILAGERTSTTRYDDWPGTDRWERLKPGSVARLYEDKEMRGQSVDVVVTGVERINLRSMDAQALEEWSKVEGWSVAHARDSARKHDGGVQIRYALPDSPEGRIALGKDVAPATDRSAAREAPAASRSVAQQETVRAPTPSVAQRAAMSDKQKALSFF